MRYSRLKFLSTILVTSLCAGVMATEEVVTVNLCDETDPFLFGCQTFTTTGVYPGIDVGGETKTLDITFGTTKNTEVKDTIVIGQTYLFGCQEIKPTVADEETSYKDSLVATTGCDSIVELKLYTKDSCHTVTNEVKDTIVIGQTYLFGCQVIKPTVANEETSYKDSLVTTTGCDSVVVLKLYTKDSCHTQTKTIVDSIPLGATYLFGCQVITPSAVGEENYVDSLVTPAGCDSVVTLTLKAYLPCKDTTVQLTDTIQLGESYLFGCITVVPTQAGDTVLTDSLTIQGGCDSVVVLTLNVLPNTPLDTTIVDTVCYNGEFAHRNGTLTGIVKDTTFTDTVVNAVPLKAGYYLDSLYIYNVRVIKQPAVPAMTDLGDATPVVVCGFAVQLDAAYTKVQQLLAAGEGDLIAKVDTFWFESQLTPASMYSAITPSFKMSDYVQEPIKIRLAIETECGDTLVSDPMDFDVEKPTPNNVKELGDMKAVSKYNDWLLMVHYNELVNKGYTVAAEDVVWYRVVGEPDDVLNIVDDVPVGAGYYYTNDQSLVGDYYAVIEAAITETNHCGGTLRTLVLHCGVASPMRLVPNVIGEGESMQLINIAPKAETKLWMYDYSGQLLDVQSTTGNETYTITPDQNAGVYMMHVTSDEQEQSFKYVITK